MSHLSSNNIFQSIVEKNCNWSILFSPYCVWYICGSCVIRWLFFWRIILFQDLIPAHDEGDPSKRLTRYKLYCIVCSFLCKYVVDYLESETERTHLHVDARHLLVGHVCCGCVWCGLYVGLLHWLCILCGCMWDYCIGFTCYVDICGTTALLYGCMWMDICAANALAVHAMWFMLDCCIGCACCLYICGSTAHVVHARWMHMGPLHWLYVMWECTGYCQRMF